MRILESARRLLAGLALRVDRTRRVARLATPVVLGSLSYTLLTVVDTAMLGRLGAVPLAAAGIAGVLYFAIAFPVSSVSVGTRTLTARRFGEGSEPQCGEVLRAGLGLACVIGGPIVVAAPWIARLIGPILSGDAAVVSLGTTYLHLRLYGSGFMILNFVFQGFYAGIGETRHQMIASIFITGTNILLDYALIFGRWGAPEMGVQGAAIATTIALGIGTVYFVAVTLRPRVRGRFLASRGLTAARHWVVPIVRLSLPIVGQRFLSHGSWFAFFAVVARIGTIELAATNIIRSIYNLSIMLAVGLGTAAAALVGQRLGAREPEDAEGLAWESVKLAAYAMTAVGLLFIFVPGAVFLIYTSDPNVIAIGRLPLVALGFVQALAAVGLVLSQALQGAGNTRFVMLAELAVCLGLYLPSVYVLGLKTPLGLVGAWTGEYIYWTALAVVMSWKFRQGGWKTIRL